MKSNIPYLILKNSAKLNKLIENNAPYEKILKQSPKLDKYIIIYMKDLNNIGVSLRTDSYISNSY